MVTKTEEKKLDKPAETSATDQQQAPVGTDLSIADLKNLGTIIDVASSRGAFRAGELATVGTMYNKLTAFLAKVAPADKQAQPIVGQDGAGQAPNPTTK
jgi:hypothetical protein